MGKDTTAQTSQERKSALDVREQGLIKREKEVSDLEGIKKKLESEYQAKKQELLALEQKIFTEKTKEITEKSNELKRLEEESAKLNRDLVVKREEMAKLKAQSDLEVDIYKTKKLEEVEKDLLTKFEANIKKIQAEYDKYLTNTTDTVKWAEDKLKKAFETLTNEFKKLLETKEKLVQQKLDDLDAAIKQYEAALEENSHIKEAEASIDLREKQLKRKQDMLEKLIEVEVRKKYAELAAEAESYKKSYNDLIVKMNELSAHYRELQNTMTSAESLDKVQLEAKVSHLSKLNEELVRKYGQYSTTEFEEIKLKASRFNTTEAENQKLQMKINTMQTQIDMLNHEKDNNDHLKYENDQLLNKIRVERLLSYELKKQIDELASRVDNAKSGIIASETIEIAYPKFVDCELSEKVTMNENEWIESIISKCKQSGYEFSRRLFYSFHTSLKTSDMSPLTVLAGVSGTGKSKLPQLYSRFGGIYFLSVPVQPDWDSPQSLFGYFNSIEKRFNATSLLRALVSFQADKSKSETRDNITDLSDRILIILLDEMNLAHVELYFSDLLSKLEERRGENKDIGFEVDLGAGNEKYSVILTDNVKWVGTMNEDETTKSLSDKVIDRGNVLSFPRPERFERYNVKQLEPEQPKIKSEVWNSWVKEKTELSVSEANYFMDIIVGINNALKNVNRALGHRVWQSIENYMMSHPLVAEFKEDEVKKMKALKYAFEEALVHKVMPKLRGIDTIGNQKTECLDVIEKILSEAELTSILPDYKNAMRSVTETFIWDSAKYLAEEYKMEV